MDQTVVEQPVPSPIRPLSRDRGRRKGEMLVGPIERDFSISRPAAERSRASRQRKKSFLSRQVPPAFGPTIRKKVGAMEVVGAPFSPFRGLMLYGALSFASVHFRQPLRPVAVLEMNDVFRRQIFFQTIITYLTNLIK